MNKDHISNQVRRLRFEHVGVTRQTIIAIESGRYSPSLPLAFRIARTFGVSVEQVFQYDEQET